MTVNETLPPWPATDYELQNQQCVQWRAGDRQWCPCQGGSDCKAPLARPGKCRGARSLAFTSSLQIPHCRTLALDGTEGLQDKVGSTIIHFEGLAGLCDHQEGGTPELRRMHI